MDAVDVFKARAQVSLGDLEKLANEIASKQAKSDQLDAVAQRFDEMNADGLIDPREMKELVDLFRANGLDASRLGDLAGPELSKLVHERIDVAKSASTISTTDRFRLQLALQDFGDNVRGASEVSAARHHAYMGVIKNLIA